MGSKSSSCLLQNGISFSTNTCITNRKWKNYFFFLKHKNSSLFLSVNIIPVSHLICSIYFYNFTINEKHTNISFLLSSSIRTSSNSQVGKLTLSEKTILQTDTGGWHTYICTQHSHTHNDVLEAFCIVFSRGFYDIVSFLPRCV